MPAFSSKNILKNPSFESSGGWEFCNQAQYSKDASHGKRSIPLNENAICKDDDSFFESKDIIIIQNGLQLDPKEEYYTLSFDLSVDSWNEGIFSSSSFSFSLYPSSQKDKDYIKEFYLVPLPGWHSYYFILSKNDIRNLVTQNNNLTLALLFQNIDPSLGFKLDHVQLRPGKFKGPAVTQMPSDLRNSPQLITAYMKTDPKKSAYSGIMTLGGKQAKIYPSFALPNYMHSYFHKNKLFIGRSTLETRFLTGKKPSTGEIIPGSSIEINEYNLNGDPKPLKQVFLLYGQPGIHSSYNASDDRLAFIFEYHASKYIPSKDRVLHSYCGANIDYRQKIIGQPACLTKVKTISGKKINGKDHVFIKGTSASISKNGMIAHHQNGSLYFSDINGQPLSSFGATIDMSDLAWSNNSNTLAIIYRSTGGIIDSNNYFDRLVLLNVNEKGRVTKLSSSVLDQYVVEGSSIAWSPDDQYIFFTKQLIHNYERQIWWLNVKTGDTGPVTTDLQFASLVDIEQ